MLMTLLVADIVLRFMIGRFRFMVVCHSVVERPSCTFLICDQLRKPLAYVRALEPSSVMLYSMLLSWFVLRRGLTCVLLLTFRRVDKPKCMVDI